MKYIKKGIALVDHFIAEVDAREEEKRKKATLEMQQTHDWLHGFFIQEPTDRETVINQHSSWEEIMREIKAADSKRNLNDYIAWGDKINLYFKKRLEMFGKEHYKESIKTLGYNRGYINRVLWLNTLACKFVNLRHVKMSFRKFERKRKALNELFSRKRKINAFWRKPIGSKQWENQQKEESDQQEVKLQSGHEEEKSDHQGDRQIEESDRQDEETQNDQQVDRQEEEGGQQGDRQKEEGVQQEDDPTEEEIERLMNPPDEEIIQATVDYYRNVLGYRSFSIY